MIAPPEPRCPRCGDKMDTAAPSAGCCYGCYLDSLLPPWYPKAEDYTILAGLLRSGQPIPVARRRPRTGVELLDAGQPARIVDMLGGQHNLRRQRCWQTLLEHMAYREATAGLTDDV